MSEATTLLDLNALANETLDSVPDVPDYVNADSFPPGAYTIQVNDAIIDSYKTKEGFDATRLKITYSVVTTKELARADDLPLPDGSLFTETFQGTEQGLSFFKKRVKSIFMVDDVAGVSLADMLQGLKGKQVDADITVKVSPNPADASKPYHNLQIRVRKAA